MLFETGVRAPDVVLSSSVRVVVDNVAEAGVASSVVVAGVAPSGVVTGTSSCCTKSREISDAASDVPAMIQTANQSPVDESRKRGMLNMINFKLML